MRLSDRVKGLAPSQTLALAAKVRELRAAGADIVDFGVGEPDFPTPEPIVSAANRALAEGFTKYGPSNGIPALREAVCAKLRRDNDLEYDSDRVVICCGAKQVLFNAAMVLFNPGDEVIILSPYWVSFPSQVQLMGAKPVIVNLPAEDDFELDLGAFEAAISERTVAVVVNSPSNPTGKLLSDEAIQGLVDVSRSNGLVILSDETYERITFDRDFRSIAAFDGAYESVLTVNTFSKTYAMTGWRVGYAAGDRALIAAITKVQGQSTSHPTSFVQMAAVEALTGDQTHVAVMRDEFRRRRDFVLGELSNLPDISCVVPEGAFFTFPAVSAYYGTEYDGKVIGNSVDFAEFLLDAVRVAVVPGAAFGVDEHVRLSFATSMESLVEGMSRIRNALQLLMKQEPEKMEISA